MNIRKTIDYSDMLKSLDTLMTTDLPQMELYCEIGQVVSGRAERRAASSAAEYLCNTYPGTVGFSPRNLRRMREFYRTYGDFKPVLTDAMTIRWTQNVVIMEAELTLEERAWYIRAVKQFEWSKLELQRKIAANAHLEIVLDFENEVCYTEEKYLNVECTADGKNATCLPYQHLQKCDVQSSGKGLIEKSGAGESVSNLTHCGQHQGDWQSVLSFSPLQDGWMWYQLHWENSKTVHLRQLWSARFSGCDGLDLSSEFSLHPWWRLGRQDVPADEISRLYGRSTVWRPQSHLIG